MPVKSIPLIVIILFSFFLMAFLILNTHYVTIGECVAIVYYIPLTAMDKLLFVIIGCMGLLISIKISNPNKPFVILLIGVYFAITFILCAFSNELLGLREEYWPHEYHPQPISFMSLYV